jgi:hypothetical protein
MSESPPEEVLMLEKREAKRIKQILRSLWLFAHMLRRMGTLSQFCAIIST